MCSPNISGGVCIILRQAESEVLMEQLNALKTLLCSFPGWGAAELAVDIPTGKPQACGLFPVGLRVLYRGTDILGNRSYRLRQSFLLRRADCAGEAAAQWLMELQSWLLLQMPRWDCFGRQVRIFAEDGRLVSSKQPGTGIYEMKIHVDYEKE